ncbi:MAG: VanZ family protein [Bacillota bacterium]|jgi:glycopeptide antibiotics resistance protein
MIASYLGVFLHDCLFAVPVYLLCRFLCVRLRCRSAGTNWYHETGLLLFVCYLVGLAGLTMNLYSVALSVSSGNFSVHTEGMNLIPFRQISAYGKITELFSFVNLLGNILLFAPIGFFVPLLWRHRHPLGVGVLYTMLFSVLVEITQLFSFRGTDIDDVILNTAGGLAGALVYLLIKKLMPELSAKFIIQKS